MDKPAFLKRGGGHFTLRQAMANRSARKIVDSLLDDHYGPEPEYVAKAFIRSNKPAKPCRGTAIGKSHYDCDCPKCLELQSEAKSRVSLARQ